MSSRLVCRSASILYVLLEKTESLVSSNEVLFPAAPATTRLERTVLEYVWLDS
jgi:hypothetical protein